MAAIASRTMSKVLYGVGPSEMISYVSAIGVLFAGASLARLIPGRRATSLDPTEAFREQ